MSLGKTEVEYISNLAAIEVKENEVDDPTKPIYIKKWMLVIFFFCEFFSNIPVGWGKFLVMHMKPWGSEH